MTKIMLKHEKKTKLPTENVLAVYQAQPVLIQTRIVTENDFYPYYQISTQKKLHTGWNCRKNISGISTIDVVLI